ncbi:MAG: glycosyltransferase family 2 protein [Christensenellaceae bacterium]|jgi:glycosyltransferase involved in cell wall biosynthesis
MKQALVSVVIPSYNYASYIEQAIRSVAAQTYPNIELVVFDDCSKDESYALLQSLCKDNALSARFNGNFRVFQNEKNLGAHQTINNGILKSIGKYVAVLNADDLYEPNRIGALLDAIGENAMAFSSIHCIDSAGHPLQSKQAQSFEAVQRHISGKPFMALSAVAENVAVSTGNLFFTKDLFLRLYGFKNYKYVHDYEFFLRACLLTEPAFTAHTSYLYRLHGSNTFQTLKKEGLRENRMVWLDFYRAIQKGQIENPAILTHSDYAALFSNEIATYGSKKQTLWNIAGNPLVHAGVQFLKFIHNIH